MWQIALAARLSKYGITLHDAMWVVPVAVLNQFLIYDEIAAGGAPRWANNASAEHDLEALLSGALTAPA